MVQRRQSERQAAQAVAGFVSDPVPVTLEDGLILVVPPVDDAAVVQPILEDRYELNELDFVRATVHPGDTVVDLGAHIGVYTLRLAQLVGPYGHVIAIEPCRAHVDCLQRSTIVNQFDGWTEIIHAAAANVGGTAWLTHPSDEGSSAHCWLGETGDGERVTTIRIDDLVARAHFMKVDIEGAEGLALRGASGLLEASRPTLLVELHPHLLPIVSGETPASLIAWVNGIGYECRLLGAGRPGEPISDTPSNGVTSAVFLPK